VIKAVLVSCFHGSQIIPGWWMTQKNVDAEGPGQGKVSWIREPFFSMAAGR
jgi:hypothetical protein